MRESVTDIHVFCVISCSLCIVVLFYVAKLHVGMTLHVHTEGAEAKLKLSDNIMNHHIGAANKL